jgi:predicted Zn-dependent peptidase
MFMLVEVDTEATQGRASTSFEEAKSAVETTVREEKLQRATVERSQGVMFSETYSGREQPEITITFERAVILTGQFRRLPPAGRRC